MAVYLIADLDIHDGAGIEDYRKRVPATIQKYGGEYLVRGGNFEKLEGSWNPKRVVILEFPGVEHAKRWYFSVEYRDLKALRQKAAKTNLVLVEGV
jgi:uncharacterized protein (DUF1330 family)